MDTNNLMDKTGMGERESRIHSKLVQQRNYYMGHGIGRSGDVNAVQPKAVGSSLILKLAIYLVKHSINIMGINSVTVDHVCLIPLATGMTL